MNPSDTANIEDPKLKNALEGLRPTVTVKGKAPVRRTIIERMKQYRIPGVSIAVIDDGKVAWSGGFGVTKAGTHTPVTGETLFQAASISKPVTAVAALKLAESGTLSLDEDVNTYLTSWKLPENEFTAHEKVTLRRILSHTAGLTVHGFPGYQQGESVPDLHRILDGEPPANTEAIRVEMEPGSAWQYSGGGYTILQQMLIDTLDEPFPALMKRLVLDPAGMEHSSFEQPLTGSREKEASSAHGIDGEPLDGRWMTYPEMAAAGLWTTSANIATYLIDITNAWNGKPAHLLSEQTVKQMLTMEVSPSGLGVMLDGEEDTFHFSHGGANEGFLSYFIMYPAAGKGAVVMTNSDLGSFLIGELFTALGIEYQWPGMAQTECEAVPLSEDAIEGLTGTFIIPDEEDDHATDIIYENGTLYMYLESIDLKTEIYHTGDDTFISAGGITFSFIRDAQGTATVMNMGGIEAIRA